MPEPQVEPSWRTKLAYGVGGVPNHFGNYLVRGLAVPFFHMTLHLNPALLGIALAIPRVCGAMLDPVFGRWSDQSRSLHGRRRPFVAAGAILSPAAFALIWWVPTHWSQETQLAWFIGASLLFYATHSLWAVPYVSLGYELSTSYHGRTRVMAVQAFFLKLAELASHWMFPLTQLAFFGSTLAGIRGVSVAAAVVAFGLFGLLPAVLVPERFVPGGVRTNSRLTAAVAELFHQRAFRFIIGLTLLKVVLGIVVNSYNFYLLVYFVSAGDLARGSVWQAVLSSSAALIGLVAIRPVVQLSDRTDKRRALAWLYVLLAIGGLVKWWVYQPSNALLLLIDPLLCGPVWIGTAVLIPSMVADICDADELESHQRREGLHGAVLLWVQKIAVAIALFVSGASLNPIGFDVTQGAAQDEGVINRMRLTVVLLTTGVALFSLLLLYFYPLSRERSVAISAALRERRERTPADNRSTEPCNSSEAAATS